MVQFELRVAMTIFVVFLVFALLSAIVFKKDKLLLSPVLLVAASHFVFFREAPYYFSNATELVENVHVIEVLLLLSSYIFLGCF